MMVLITYDVNTETEAGKKRLRKISKECSKYGQRVQNSVFECLIDPAIFKKLQLSINKIIDPDKDSVRFYNLGNHWKSSIEHFGVNRSFDIEGLLLV